MDTTMPFSKLDLDPEHIEAIHDAFRRVCDILRLDCCPDLGDVDRPHALRL
jgi:hypothetical protein